MSPRDNLGSVFHDFPHVIFRHKRKSAIFFLVVVAGAALWTFLTPREYRSQSKLFVRLGRENATLDPTATPGQTPIVAVPQSRESEINSVVEILQSRVLFEKVVDGLGAGEVLAADSKAIGRPSVFNSMKNFLRQFSSSAGLEDRERAVQLLAKNVAVEAAKKSNVVEVTYEGPSPANSQAVVAKLIDCYVGEHVQLNRPHGSHQFFTEQTRRLRDDLSRKERELRDLKNATGLASPSAQRQLLVARMGRLQDELLHAEASQAVAQAKVRELRAKLVSLPATEVSNETSGINDEGTDRMRDQFYTLQVRQKEYQAKYTDNHPKLQQIHDQVAKAKVILDREERNRKQVTKEPSRLHQQARMTLLAEEPALAALETQARELRKQLAGVRQELTALNENELRVAVLQREADLLETDYRKYSNSQEQARIDQQLDAQRMSNISIVQPASFEPRPVRPRVARNLLLGIFAGLLGALAIPLTLEQLGSPGRAESGHLAPTLTAIPRLKPRRLRRAENRYRNNIEDDVEMAEQQEMHKAK